jgi:hypothetical protein
MPFAPHRLCRLAANATTKRHACADCNYHNNIDTYTDCITNARSGDDREGHSSL